MLRYTYFRLRFNQWFKNQEGLKAFAQQCMNWLMRSTLSLAYRLKKRNKQFSGKNKELNADLSKCLASPMMDADDFASLQKEIRNYIVIERCIIIAEAFFNFFAAKALFNFSGWLAIAAQVFFSLVVTWVSIPLFRNLFFHAIHERPYKREHVEPRSWPTLILLILLATLYELGIYYLCKLRGEQIEGGTRGFITTLMVIIGMLLPVIAGYFAYERRRYYSPYINTLRINKLRHRIACYENKIQTNIQRMENHFKQKCEDYWAYFQEFKAYKENYNRKNSIPEESLAGHFAETQTAFITEAIERYKKEAIVKEKTEPAIMLAPVWSQQRGNNLKELFN